MSPLLIFIIVLSYFGVLLVVSFFTSRNVNNAGFFLGNKKSPWYIVAIGMLGSSISGVTFISVPGWVQTTQMTYLQMVLGFVAGYVVIAHVLLPLYYRLNLTSIYTYLDLRFGRFSYKTGASFFLLSRSIGSAARLYVVANVLQIVIFNQLNIPFWVTVIVTILLIWLYTFKGGIKTIIWTDTLQTIFLFTALIATIIIVARELGLDFSGIVSTINNSEMSKVFEFKDWRSSQHFLKQFLSGAFITIVMTGLDQDVMQKNLSCRNIKEAKRNMLTYGVAFLPANLLFLSLGILLMTFVNSIGIPADSELIAGDNLYPYVATTQLGPVVLILFLIGLMASAYSSADSALAALTTSFTVDIIGIKNKTEQQIKKTRTWVHLAISFLMAIMIIVFNLVNEKSIINAIYAIAGYTYGPLLGLYAFGLFTKYKVRDKIVPIIAILSPILCYLISYLLKKYADYNTGYELLLLNGFITFMGLWAIRKMG
ncbi:MAG: sodium:solute symporter [Bacteroidales bacterium]|jgi:SSS family solute:Na+ symporter|nr:sodium:solute symporter [Bacteroidales bacterium]HNY44079.1 sodium:solute symporter [Bacteroidales bacterium]